MSRMPASPSVEHDLNPRSCTTCYRRKVRCDRKQPCSNCKRTVEHCVFPDKRITRRRQRCNSSGSDHIKQALSPDAVSVHATLPRRTGAPTHEAATNRLITDPRGNSRLLPSSSWVYASPSVSPLAKRDPVQQDVGLRKRQGQRFVDHALLAMAEPERRSTSSSPNYLAASPAASSHASPGGECNCGHNPESLWRPSTIQLEACWHIFVESVDPIIRILHKPSVRVLIDQAMRGGLEELDNESVVLLLSVCYAAIISISGWKCEAIFSASRATMERQASASIEVGLKEAGLLDTHVMTVLQAFVLYLVGQATPPTQAKLVRLQRSSPARKEISPDQCGHWWALRCESPCLLAYIATKTHSIFHRSKPKCDADCGGKSSTWMFELPRTTARVVA